MGSGQCWAGYYNAFCRYNLSWPWPWPWPPWPCPCELRCCVFATGIQAKSSVTRHQATLRLSQGRQWPPSCCLSVTRHQATLRLSQGRQWPPSCCLSPPPGLWPRGALAHPPPMAARSMARGLQPPAGEHVGQGLRSQLARICEGAACTMQVAVSRSEAMGNYSGD